MDIDRVGRGGRQNAKAAYFFDQPHDTALFHFEPIPASFGVIRNGDCGEILYPNTIRDLIEFSLRECVKQEIPVRRCRSCGRYFPNHRAGHGGVLQPPQPVQEALPEHRPCPEADGEPQE